MPLGGCPGHGPNGLRRDEREQAPVTGLTFLVAALAVTNPLPGEHEQLTQAFGRSELGKVPGAAGHDVVQEQAVVVVAAVAEGRVDDVGDLDVVGVPADLFAKAQEQGRGQARQGEGVADGHGVGQPDEQTLGAQRAGEDDRTGVLGRRVTVGAPRAVFVALVASRVGIELAAARA
ncbi:hypothetical protein GALL_284900 [mine drainage metagenome]|uniref:Uncharacterized protein n=1 Tax=mine drainage metagenome TaxID=410659 RepID=A0A1J5RJ55_9ZZZZ